VNVWTDISYDAPCGLPIHLDLLVPESDRPVPVVLMIHGGGWISGDRTMVHDEARWLAPQGFACACVDYRLAPLHPYPAAVEDVRSAIRFLRGAAPEYGLDAGRVAALGHSAGGHLALTAALTGAQEERADAAIAMCPITDLTDPRAQHLAIAWSFLEQFMGGAFEQQPERWREASPIAHASDGASPVLLVHGENDDVVPVAQSRALAQALRKAGRDVTLLELLGEMHAFSMPAWLRIRDAYLAFLRRVCAA
jgi:acetyl esterase/lipase